MGRQEAGLEVDAATRPRDPKRLAPINFLRSTDTTIAFEVATD